MSKWLANPVVLLVMFGLVGVSVFKIAMDLWSATQAEAMLLGGVVGVVVPLAWAFFWWVVDEGLRAPNKNNNKRK